MAYSFRAAVWTARSWLPRGDDRAPQAAPDSGGVWNGREREGAGELIRDMIK